MRRPHPRYRSSGVEWLGDVPEHWQEGMLRRWFTIVNGGTPASTEESYWDGETVWLTPDDLGQNEGAWINSGRRTITDEGVYNSSARVSPAGSLVLSTRAPIGHLAITTVPAATNQGCRTLIPDRNTDSTFGYYMLLASRSVLQSLGKGSTFMELTPIDLGGLQIALPPLSEQRTIAEYLDRETERIDALVAKVRLLIERLQEYRAALVTRTVTRGLPPEAARAAGLDPSPRLKPSGVEWLGEVPEHWEVKRLKHMASYQTSSVDKKVEEGQIPVRLCNYTDVYYLDRIRISQGNFMEATATRREIARFQLEPGDVVITKDSEDWQDIGIPALVDEAANDFVCGYHLGIIKPCPGLHPSFLFRLMQSGAVNQRLQTSASGVTRYGLPNSAVRDVTISFPPLSEQRAIAVFLDRETERIDALVAKKRLLIERLQEYRTALITAAVTGKVDVREPVAVERS